jgi:hypothetical protein
MSFKLWQKLPEEFLKMKYGAWVRLDDDVKLLVVALANKQSFKCVYCSRKSSLVIEHDHDPEHGASDRYTIYNVRGLVCSRCNWHLMLYEKDERGEHRGWDHVDSYISSHEYENYVYAYECRTGPLLEELLEERLGSRNYWRRRIFLGKFDDWKYEGGEYPWCWGFEEIKDERYGSIRTPAQFIRALSACVQFVSDELKKDPNFRPPESFFKIMVLVEPLMDKVRPIVGERLKVISGGKS